MQISKREFLKKVGLLLGCRLYAKRTDDPWLGANDSLHPAFWLIRLNLRSALSMVSFLPTLISFAIYFSPPPIDLGVYFTTTP